MVVLIARYERDVLSHAQIADETKVLMDERERQPLRPRGDHTTSHPDLALVRHVNAGQDLDEGAFPCPVLAEERVDLTRIEIKVDAIEGERATELLAEPSDPDESARRGPRALETDLLCHGNLGHQYRLRLPMQVRRSPAGGAWSAIGAWNTTSLR